VIIPHFFEINKKWNQKLQQIKSISQKNKGGESITLYDLNDALETYLQGIEVYTRITTTIKPDNRNIIITSSIRQWEPFNTGESK
jgi:hypothetical protein